jgi:hypothetical protein
MKEFKNGRIGQSPKYNLMSMTNFLASSDSAVPTKLSPSS